MLPPGLTTSGRVTSGRTTSGRISGPGPVGPGIVTPVGPVGTATPRTVTTATSGALRLPEESNTSSRNRCTPGRNPASTVIDGVTVAIGCPTMNLAMVSGQARQVGPR
jgi:hypothetical protein